MSPIKIAAIVLVIGAVLFGSYLIIQSSFQTAQSGGIQTAEPAASTSKNPIKWIEQLIPHTNTDGGNLAVSGSNTNQGPGSSSNNLTQLAAGSLLDKFKSLDSSGQNPFQNFDSKNPQNQQMLQDAINGVKDPFSAFSYTVHDSDLKIKNDNSKESKTEYLNHIISITKNRFNDLKYQRTIDQIEGDISNDCLIGSGESVNQELSGVYGGLVNDYLNLSVPSDWVPLHKKIIIQFKSAEAIYGALGNCSKDPIRGYLAAQALPQLIQNAQQNQDELTRESKSVGI